MTVITRFAPSPTGYLHVGNIRTALISWLYAKSNNGKFMLRLDDTDLLRSKEIYADQIIKDMKWLGLTWDIFATQSNRLDRYEEIKKILIDKKRLYPCFETQEELEIKRKMQLKRGLPPIYDRTALKLSQEEIYKLESQGRIPHYRFFLNDSKISWNDKIRGETHFEGKNLSDPIIIREDKSMTYILTSVVDDIDFLITDIIRGEDHVSNTAIQIQIFEALNAKTPNFAHLARVKSADNEISKRTGGFDIKSLKENYIEAMSINSLFAKIGSSDSVEITNSLTDLTKNFALEKFSRSPSTYDPADLYRINHKLLAGYDYTQVESALHTLGIYNIDQEFWLKIRNNIKTIDEAVIWFNICQKEVTPIIEDSELLLIASDTLPKDPWDDQTWNLWINDIKKHTNKKGKELFMPIRKSLTALDNGPELKFILPLIGRVKVKERLKGEIA